MLSFFSGAVVSIWSEVLELRFRASKIVEAKVKLDVCNVVVSF